MSVLLINPNSTEAMTASVLQAARIAGPGLSWEGWTSHDGPPAIQGAEDGALARGPLLSLLSRKEAQQASGIVIACFDDTALVDASHAVPCPVIGIGQAAFHQCAMRSWTFSVVTTLSVSIPVIEDNIRQYGLAGHLGRVRASEVPVLDLERDPDAAIAPILKEARRAVADDGIDALVLGCAGMVNVVRALRTELPVPVIDPVEAAAGAMGWLAASDAAGPLQRRDGRAT